ncbi:hypothetical protein C2E23DRAFT_799371 [Lenzites betulinus]|nr:hypothetical protein C2E23DRAFT_799371 [Lenzites betulinus]
MSRKAGQPARLITIMLRNGSIYFTAVTLMNMTELVLGLSEVRRLVPPQLTFCVLAWLRADALQTLGRNEGITWGGSILVFFINPYVVDSFGGQALTCSLAPNLLA